MQHIQFCLEQQAKEESWKQAWSNHCQKCYGAGWMYSTYDPSPVGVSLGSGFMTDADPCEECLNKGICPRCGQSGMLTDDGEDIREVCPSCGWKEGTEYAGWECYCWEELTLYKETYAKFGITI